MNLKHSVFALAIAFTAVANAAPPGGVFARRVVACPPPEPQITVTPRRLPARAELEFSLRIVSGSRAGELATGRVTIHPRDLPRHGNGLVTASRFTFKYAGETFTEADLDAPAQVRLERGEPVELIAVGGPGHLRFGFSAGFDRGQFGRAEEQFINAGEPYFGYLDPSTYVDGAGRVSFRRLLARAR